jgi:hypothetical protein
MAYQSTLDARVTRKGEGIGSAERKAAVRVSTRLDRLPEIRETKQSALRQLRSVWLTLFKSYL